METGARRRLAGRILPAVPPLLFLFLFFYLPLLLVFADPAGTGGAGAVPLGAVVSSPYYRRILGFTAWQSLVSTLFALLLGLPGAWILGRFRFPGKSFVKSLTTIPFVLPSILVVLGFVLFFGNQGHLNRFLMGLLNREEPPLKILYSFRAVILAHGFYNFPVVMRLVSSAQGQLSRSQHDAARSLGAGGFRLFRTVTLAQLLPAILSAASLVFLFCFMSFAVILVLGGGPRFTTVEVEIYRLARFSMDFPAAAALGFWGTLCSMALLSANLFLEGKAGGERAPGGRREEEPLAPLLKKPRGLLVLFYLALAVLLILGPLVSVAVNSFQMRQTRGGDLLWTLKWYRQLTMGRGSLPSDGVQVRAVANSLKFALGTVAAALPLGTLLAFLTVRSRRQALPAPKARRRKRTLLTGSLLQALFMLPMGVSPVLLGLGYLRLLGDGSLRGSWLAIVGAHTVIAYPFVIRAVGSSLRNLSSSLDEAAASLGASPLRVLFTVDLPLIRSGLLAGAAFAFALSLGEINATLLLAEPEQITIPLAMYRLLGAYQFNGACVLGTLLMLLCGAAFWIIDRFEESTW